MVRFEEMGVERLLKWSLVLLFVWLGCGCVQSPGLTGGFSVETKEGGWVVLTGSPGRLRDDLKRAARALGWALRKPVSMDQAIWQSKGYLPDGRSYFVQAKAGPRDTTVQVLIRIGHFGDEVAEARYIQQLAQVMAGKPAPRRLPRFTLPRFSLPWDSKSAPAEAKSAPVP